MKKSALILSFITLINTVYAQTATSVVYKATGKNERFIIFDGYHQLPVHGVSSGWVSVMDTHIDDIYASMKEPVYARGYHPKFSEATGKWIPKTSIMLGVAYATKNNKHLPRYTVPSLSKSYTGYMLGDGNSAVEVVALGINEENIHDYRFRVIENDSVQLTTWVTPQLEQKHGAKHAYAYFGKFYSPGKEVTVEVVSIKNYNVRDGIVLNWRNHLKPVINNIIGYKKGKGVNAVKLNRQEPVALSADSLGAVNLSFKDHQTLPYDIYWLISSSKYTADTDTILIQSGLRENFFSLSNQYFATPGRYKILVYPVGTKDKNREATLAFNVQGPSGDEKSYTVLQILPYFLLVILAFSAYYLYNKRKVRKMSRQKEIATLKLGSVRAQLNPHFMFNALSSIQSLMNQGNNTDAINYLGKFATLTRLVLNTTAREMISLEDELKIVKNYLQIEQLRFGFNFEVAVDQAINAANTEIPGMLMQPFIENAAKHGVSGLGKLGKINIAINKSAKDMVLTIADNGKGFDINKPVEGFGLKLSRERIALLNEIYKGQVGQLVISSGLKGTFITITLKQWF